MRRRFESPSRSVMAMPARLQASIERELEVGEQIVWSAQPIPRRFAYKATPLVLFGIPWTAFSVFWTAGAAGFRVPSSLSESMFPLFGVPFVLIGLGMLTSPVWMWLVARRTAYVLTNRRAITFDGGIRSTTVQSFAAERVRDLRRREHRDLSGDLIFETRISRDSDGDRREKDVGFLAIADVKEVEGLVRKTLAPPGQRQADR